MDVVHDKIQLHGRIHIHHFTQTILTTKCEEAKGSTFTQRRWPCWSTTGAKGSLQTLPCAGARSNYTVLAESLENLKCVTLSILGGLSQTVRFVPTFRPSTASHLTRCLHCHLKRSNHSTIQSEWAKSHVTFFGIRKTSSNKLDPTISQTAQSPRTSQCSPRFC